MATEFYEHPQTEDRRARSGYPMNTPSPAPPPLANSRRPRPLGSNSGEVGGVAEFFPKDTSPSNECPSTIMSVRQALRPQRRDLISGHKSNSSHFLSRAYLETPSRLSLC